MNAINAIGIGEDVSEVVGKILRGGNQTRTTSETLPPETYTSEAFFELEAEKVFRQDWVCIGTIHQVPNVGDYFTLDVLGEPLVVVYAQDGVHVLSRACLHRWAPVASGSGNTKVFVCPFHKWAYDLTGRLVAAPFMEKAEQFDTSECNLQEFRSYVIPQLGFIFVNISGDAKPIGTKLDSFIETYGNWKVKDLSLGGHSVNEFDFNWKIQIETAMECYHHIGAHSTTFEPIQPARLSSCDDSEEGWTVCHSPFKADLGPEAYTMGMVALPDLTPEQRKTCDYVLIYPNLFLVMRSEVVTVMPVLPVSAKKCIALSARLVRPETLAEPGMMEKSAEGRKEFMVKITAEDVGINLQQQQTLTTSRHLRPGRLSHLETTVWDLANHIRSRLGDAA